MNDLIIPDEVVNIQAYKKWSILKNHPILRNPMYTSSEGIEYNISMLPHYLRKRVEHLSSSEQDAIMELKVKWNQLALKTNVAKAAAFGRQGKWNQKAGVKVVVIPFEEDITELLGKMFTIPEIVKIMGEDNGVICTEDEVKLVLKKRIVEIEKRRDEFRNRVADVRLYNKRPRLEELAWMYNQMRMRYVAVRSVDAYNCMLRTLEQIRKESEGDILNINGALSVNIEVEIQNHIQKQILLTINLKETILGRVSARMGYDPKKLIAGLHNSYYNKFVQISGDFDPDAEMHYPSTQNYDFTVIQKNANVATVDISAEDVTEKEKTSSQNIKDLFLAKIRKQKDELEARQAAMNAEVEKKRKEVRDDDEVKRPKHAGSGRDKILATKKKAAGKRIKEVDYKTGARPKKK